MEILPRKVFKCLAKELLQEKKKHSYYYKHLYRQGLFLVPGTAISEERVQQGIQDSYLQRKSTARDTGQLPPKKEYSKGYRTATSEERVQQGIQDSYLRRKSTARDTGQLPPKKEYSKGYRTATSEERVQQGIQEIAMEALKFASYTVGRLIKSHSPLKTLETLYDLLGALGKAFLLNVKVSNNGKLLEICYEEEMALQCPLREFRVELRDQSSIASCKLNALPSAGAANSSAALLANELPTSSSKSSPSPSSSSSSSETFEDIYFGKTLEESAVKPKKPRKRCRPASISHTLTESSSEGESGEKSSAPDPGKKVQTEREAAMGSGPFTDQTPSKKKARARPLSDYTSDEEEPPLLKKVSPKRVVSVSRVGDDKATFKIGSSLDAEVTDQRRLMWEIAEKHVEWCRKPDKHLLSHVTDCSLCPIHCLGPVNKKITRESGRKVGSKRRK